MSEQIRDASGTPLRHTAVVEAMRSVQVHRSHDGLRNLYQTLLDTMLFVPIPDGADGEGWTSFEAGATLSVILENDDDGATFLAFTSPDTILQWRPEGSNYVAMNTPHVFEMASGMDVTKVVIDAGSEVWSYWAHHELAPLALGDFPADSGTDDEDEENGDDTVVYVGRPAKAPHPDALDAVVSSLLHEPTATGAWYFQMFSGSAPELAIAVRFRDGTSDGDQEEAIHRVAEGAAGLSREASAIVFVNADGGYLEPVVNGVGEPIFSK